jgi:hypothetical protein
MYFPELTGSECQILLKGMCQDVQMTVDEACCFVAAASKAAQEVRVFRGEDRFELNRILGHYKQRVMRSLVGAEQPK